MWWFKKEKVVMINKKNAVQQMISEILQDNRFKNIFIENHYGGLSPHKRRDDIRFYLNVSASYIKRCVPDVEIVDDRTYWTEVSIPIAQYKKEFIDHIRWEFQKQLQNVQNLFKQTEFQEQFAEVFYETLIVLKEMFDRTIQITEQNYQNAVNICKEMIQYLEQRELIEQNNYDELLSRELQIVKQIRENTGGVL